MKETWDFASLGVQGDKYIFSRDQRRCKLWEAFDKLELHVQRFSDMFRVIPEVTCIQGAELLQRNREERRGKPELH